MKYILNDVEESLDIKEKDLSKTIRTIMDNHTLIMVDNDIQIEG